MSGKGIGKVGNVGRAPEEYLNLTDFSINKDGNIHIIDGRLDKMNIYDKNLNFITSQKLPFEAADGLPVPLWHPPPGSSPPSRKYL